MLSIAERLQEFRDLLKTFNIDAYIIPTDDSHGSEYPPKSDARREYISGFTGSAGTAVITQNEALLWTDGRYFNQAGKELDPQYWKLMKDIESPSIALWLRDNDNINRIGYDPTVTSIASYKSINTSLNEMYPYKDFLPISDNLVDLIWNLDGRPAPPRSKVDVLGIEYSGISVERKIAELREKLKKEKIDGVVLSRLDDSAWLTNMRGSDINYCPVFLSYIYISQDQSRLYIDDSRLSDASKKHLTDNQIEIRPYDSIFVDLNSIYGSNVESNRLWLDEVANMRLYNAIENPNKRVFVKLSPVQLPKSIKNNTELEGMKEAHIRDALAECTFLAWLEDLAQNNEEELKKFTEWSVGQKLDHLRKLMLNNRGLSFNTISSMGPNSAVIHYAVKESTALHLSRDIYLVDSGGQYLEGTTDITRTLHLGSPTDIQKQCYTLVLKGHLHLGRQVFPKGTKGTQLDCLARHYLWSNGLNYSHGTGHGVGSYLNVHEGPQMIRSPTVRTFEEPSLQPGMVVSNEPGYYRNDEFGIRIENLVFVKKVAQLSELQSEDYYGFEDLTLVPHQKKMIDVQLLTDQELSQLNAYHERTKSIILPRLLACDCLPNKGLTKTWLEDSTTPLTR